MPTEQVGRSGGGPMMPPMYPPQGGGDGKERETWLQEDEDVWMEAEDVAMAVLGRPAVEDEEDLADEDWGTPVPEPARGPKSRPRAQRGRPNWPSSGTRFGG